MFYHERVARVRVFDDIQNFALRAWHSLRGSVLKLHQILLAYAVKWLIWH